MALTGNLHVPDLVGVIQLVCLERRTAHLRVLNRARIGSIYFAAGQAVHAQFEELEGEAAFQRILQLEGGVFELEYGTAAPRRTIARSTQALMLEVLRRQDEKGQPAHDVAETLARALVGPGLSTGLVVAEQDGTLVAQHQLADPEGRARLIAHLLREAEGMGGPLRLGAVRRVRLYAPDNRTFVAVPYGPRWLGLEAERGPAERKLEAAVEQVLDGEPGAGSAKE